MPLKTKYIDEFKQGDLVYGLEAERKELMAKKFRLSGPDIRTVNLATINNYATTLSEKDTVEERLKYARSVDPTAYRDAISKFDKALTEHGKYGSAVGWSADTKAPEFGAQQNDAWRKKCKGGLYLACFIEKKNVHFCAEGMDMKAVVTKTAVNKEGAKLDSSDPVTGKLRAVTNAELRWVYRNKEYEEVIKAVQFWSKASGDWAPCAPPWEDDAKLWLGYIPKRSVNVHGKKDD